MQIQSTRLLLSLAVLAAVLSVLLVGRTFGEVTERISDSTGATVPAVQVALTSVSTSAVRTAVSTDSGNYTFPAVELGAYAIKVEKQAFKAASSTNVEVQIQQTVHLEFTLGVRQIPNAPRTAPRGARLGFPATFGATFTELMLTDLIPMIEQPYRVLPGWENRAMAGPSMGGMKSFQTALGNLDEFSYLGAFSGSDSRGGVDPKTSNNGVFADAAAFNKMKVLFLGIGSVEGPNTKKFSEELTVASIHNTYFESPGTAREWLTWRRCLDDFAFYLFK